MDSSDVNNNSSVDSRDNINNNSNSVNSSDYNIDSNSVNSSSSNNNNNNSSSVDSSDSNNLLLYQSVIKAPTKIISMAQSLSLHGPEIYALVHIRAELYYTAVDSAYIDPICASKYLFQNRWKHDISKAKSVLLDCVGL